MQPISTIRRRGLAILGATAIAALLAASSLTGASASGSGAHRAPRRAKAVRVDIGDFAFHPRTLRVGRGTKVVFANGDSIAHTATRPGSFDTGHIQPGRSATVTLRRAGVYAYHCTIHSFMHGKIVVR